MNAGDALAEAIVAYFASRLGTTGKSVRLLVVDFPAAVQEEAARSLVKRADGRGDGTVSLRLDVGSLDLAVAFIQSAENAQLELLSERGFVFGTSPDFPVGLRNRRGNVLVFCPPELLEACHESIKANTFQRFEENRKFGTQRTILQRLREANGFPQDSEELSYVCDEKLKEDRKAVGEIGWARTWSELERALSEERVDPRTIGLLPSSEMSLDSHAAQLRRAVRKNLAFQRSLVEGLAQGQRRFLERSFGDRAGFEDLMAYLARFDFRLRHDDSRWRTEWPEGLLIDDLERSRDRVRAVSITSFEVAGANSVNGLQVASSASVELRWRARGRVDDAEVNVTMDGRSVDAVPVADGRANLELPDRRTHRVELVGLDQPVRGHTSLLVAYPPDEGLLVLGIGGGTPGARRYDVVRNEAFLVRWWIVPHLPGAESADVYLVSSSSDPEGGAVADDRLESVTDGRSALEVEGGIEDSVEVLVQATLPTGESFEAEVRVDVREPERAPQYVGNVGRAIARLAGTPEARVNADEAPAQKAVRVVPNPEGFDVFLESEGSAVPGRYRLLRTDLLDKAESEFLADPGLPWPRVARAERAGRSTVWEIESLPEEFLPSVPTEAAELHRDFLSSREALFKHLEDRGSVGSTELVDVREHIESYASRYAELMAAISRDGREVDRYASLISMTDGVLLAEGSHETARALLLAPTHPLRIAWLLQFEDWVREMVQAGTPWAALPVAGLDSGRFPTHLVDWNRRHLRGTATALDGNWLLMIPEDEAEVDQILPAEVSRALPLDSPGETISVSNEQLAVAIRQYHDLHPMKDVMRLAYIGAGTAERLREAIEQVVAGSQERGVAAVTASRLRVELELLDVAERAQEFDYSTGQAFEDYVNLDPDPEILRRLTFAVRHLDRDAFLDESQYSPQRFHLVFGSELFQRRGRTDPIGNATSPLCRGLVLHHMRTLEFRDNPVFRLVSVVPPPTEASGLAHTIHRICFAHQSIAAVTRDRPSASTTEARGTVVELGLAEQRALDRMHELAEWVYLMDSNVDVEYFDNPTVEGRYVLDYVPRFLAAARGSRRHSYLITSEDDVLIKHAINFFLHPAYIEPGASSDFDDAHKIVRDALNRLSGRQVFRLVGEPSWAKGAVGIAFAALLYRLAGPPIGPKANGTDFSLILLIPIDDYAGEWRSDAAAAGFQVSGHHADLLALGISLTAGEVVLEPLVIEVKNRRHAYSIGDLHSGPFVQLERTARLLEVVLGLGRDVSRADRELKHVQLAELIDYHLRRFAMQRWGRDSSILEEAQEFRQAVFQAVAHGAFKTHWPHRSGFPLWGLVLHFNASEDQSGSWERIRELIGEGGFGAYIPFGLPDAQDLLRESAPEHLGEIAHWLDPRTPPPERPGAGGPPGPETPWEPGPTPRVRPDSEEVGADAMAGLSPLLERAAAAFVGFIGNDPAKQRLIPWVGRALQDDPPRLAENIAFTGPASTGKTELSRRVAQALGLPFVSVAGSALVSLDDLLNRMEQEARDEGAALVTVGRQGGLPVVQFPPMVVFIDEAHELRRAVQEQLLTLLEPSTRRAAGSHIVADVAHVTFIIATTDWGDLIATLQTRFQRVALQSYTEDEVAEIVRRQFPQWEDYVCRKLAIAGRLIPRQALQRASEFANAVEMFLQQSVEETLDFYYRLWEINSEGLNRLDLEYLGVLDESAGPVGLSRVATRLGLGEREIERNLEPFLLQLGLVEVSTQGRTLTHQGKAYLRSLPNG